MDNIQKIVKKNGSKFRFLIVDDSLFQRKNIAKFIEKMNCEVAGEAVDGQDAVCLYKEIKPDIVTLDITMPGMNGYEALKEIISFDSNAVIVMVSALKHDKIIDDCINAGAKFHIGKPFKPEETAFLLCKALRKYYDADYLD
ncbi:MAG TPA: response regulator [bacterium]|nr:response regulator [bacterium]HPN30537.1 response regulator [bacterium]